MPDCIHFAAPLSGEDRGKPLAGSDEIAAALYAPAPAWVHMDWENPDTDIWIDTHLGYLPQPVREALVEDETRPRAVMRGDGVLVILRGVNLNPGAEPEDMISVRLWLQEGRVISLSRRRLKSVDALAARVMAGEGPETSGALLADLIDGLNERFDDYIGQLGATSDRLEEDVLREPDRALRASITDTRGELVDVRRYLVPQRDAVLALSGYHVDVLHDDDRLRLSEAHDRLVRAVEEVESQRERLVVVQDELTTALSDRLNRNLYVLSMISAIFLPLGVLTGLMGINVAGMPGANWPPAFWVFSGLLCVIVVIQVLILRALRWL
ncbi:zinc transporter ZntB [Anianabacter salinae]|uniref:zinc transporter ZntB n=1 Tax=Anianabacter salinae TaxID=2851023 RepID=UPI00225E054C|nr:zinc transporter ZntB [Anianabacter salinae]MBV0913174.1 zinc transporter ZntB [Anianabacter salinae]